MKHSAIRLTGFAYLTRQRIRHANFKIITLTVLKGYMPTTISFYSLVNYPIVFLDFWINSTDKTWPILSHIRIPFQSAQYADLSLIFVDSDTFNAFYLASLFSAVSQMSQTI